MILLDSLERLTSSMAEMNRLEPDTGGYPEVVFSERGQEDLSRFINSDVIDKALLRDLTSLFFERPADLKGVLAFSRDS